MTNVDLPKAIPSASQSQQDNEGDDIDELSPMFEKVSMPKDLQLQSVIEYYKVIDSSAGGAKEPSDSDDDGSPQQRARRISRPVPSPTSEEDDESIADLRPSRRELPKIGSSRRFSNAEKGAHRRLSRLDMSMQKSQELREKIEQAATAGSRVASLPNIGKKEGSHTVGAPALMSSSLHLPIRPERHSLSPVEFGAVHRLSETKDLHDKRLSNVSPTKSPRLKKSSPLHKSKSTTNVRSSTHH